MRSLSQNQSQNQSASIVSTVGGMVIRESFATRKRGMRRWQRSGQTRTFTTLLMVCLSLRCHYLGVRLLCVQFQLGEVEVFLHEVVLRELPRGEVRPARGGGQTASPQGAGQFRFRGRDADRFGSFDRGTGGRRVESGRGVFAGRSPSRGQYEFGRDGRSFVSQRRYGPRLPFRGDRSPPARHEKVQRGGSFGMRDRMDVANPTFEQMARHWFNSFCSNPSVESFAQSRSRF